MAEEKSKFNMNEVVKVINAEAEWLEIENKISEKFNNIFLKDDDPSRVFYAEPWARILYKHKCVSLTMGGMPKSKNSKVDYYIYEIWKRYFKKSNQTWTVFCQKVKLTRKPEHIQDKARETALNLPYKIIEDLEKCYIDNEYSYIEETERQVNTAEKTVSIHRLKEIAPVLFRHSIIDRPFMMPYKISGNPDFVYSVWRNFFKKGFISWNDFSQYFIFSPDKEKEKIFIKNLPKRKNRKELTENILKEISEVFQKV